VTIHKRRRSAVWPYWAVIVVALVIAVIALATGYLELSAG
jgi:hypothetical protein